MAPLIRRARQWLSQDTTIYECRNCGLTVDAETESCPSCGSETISCYEL